MRSFGTRLYPFEDGVKYDVIMEALRQNSHEALARARIFESLGSPITEEDVAIAVAMADGHTAFWDRLTYYKVSRLSRRRRWQLRIKAWWARHFRR